MMMNLFSVFDPVSSLLNFSFNWGSMMIFVGVVSVSYWVGASRHLLLFSFVGKSLGREVKMLLGSSDFPGAMLLGLSIFIFLFLSNVGGLFPYVFTATSHMVVTLSLSLTFWVSFMLWGWVNNSVHMFVHLVPQGAPSVLMVFMVLIETVSNIIRPLTLAVRLAANMIAGHLLLTLLGDLIVSVSLSVYISIFPVEFMLFVLELAVAMIQAYVFLVLVSLYASEVN